MLIFSRRMQSIEEPLPGGFVQRIHVIVAGTMSHLYNQLILLPKIHGNELPPVA
ncbi:hypothetical protein ACFSOZ_34535 [Mesorhizobium newzealandense]|uniref:Uncharacterized protein n=1 Tax=Mesorhizobium newzealandense TaxID=1300302 RepID=A0ABW4UPM3_9HYPH